MKKTIVFILTVLLIGVINYLGSFLLKINFIDISFITGLIAVLIFKFFTSFGGFSSNSLRLQVQSQTGIKVEHEKAKFSPSLPFYSAIFYTVASAITTIIYYKNYFL